MRPRVGFINVVQACFWVKLHITFLCFIFIVQVILHRVLMTRFGRESVTNDIQLLQKLNFIKTLLIVIKIKIATSKLQVIALFYFTSNVNNLDLISNLPLGLKLIRIKSSNIVFTEIFTVYKGLCTPYLPHKCSILQHQLCSSTP